MTLTKTVLFFPLNSPGHVNSSLGIADVLREDHGYRTVFLVLGQPLSSSIRDHGHELVILEEANVYEDFEIDEDEDASTPVDEEAKLKQGKTKKVFSGFLKWPQIIQRYSNDLRLEPLEAFIKSLGVMDKLMVGELVDNYASYEAAIKTIKPDIVIVDNYYIPPCIVSLKHIPWVRLFSANPLQMTQSKLPSGLKPPAMCGWSFYTKEAREKMRQEEPEKWEEMLNKWRSAFERIAEAADQSVGPHNQFYEEHNCEPLKPGQMGHDSPHLNLYMFPKEIDYDQDDDLLEYPPRWFRCDSLVRRPLSQKDSAQARAWNEKLNAGMKNKREMVFFSLGSIASGNVTLVKKFVNVFKDDAMRLYVVSKGVNGHKFELDYSNMIGDNYIPQTLILERADLAIIHGGNNSITECLYYGVPMIVLPVFADQLDNAQRIEDLGLGKRLDIHNCTSEQLNQAINTLLTDRNLIEKVSELGKRMRARDDSTKISLILKKLIEERSLSQEFIEYCRNKNYDEIQI